jgi:cytochrome c biogenesis factor
MFSILGAIIFLLISIFTLLVACGLPLGEFTMGGQNIILPKQFRIMAFLSLIVQIFAIIIILQCGSYISFWFSPKTTKYICIFYAAYLSLNSVMNFLSNSKKEKYVMTPLSLLAAICFWITSFSI